jgi:hypothetical protein
VDVIQEFKLLTGVYSAEYGRSVGGQVIVVTKSGSNALHGSLYEFIRNGATDAKNFFTAAGVTPKFNRNNYGATIGGPVRKDKTFFFFGWEGLQLVQQVAGTATVPLPAMINGDFSSLLALKTPIQLKYPVSIPGAGIVAGANIPGNIIPQSLISSVGQKLLSYYPSPTLPTAAGSSPANNFILNGTRTESMNEYTARVDHQLGSKDNIFVNYNRMHDPVFEVSNPLCGSAVLPGYGCTVGNDATLGAIVEDHVFSPALVNEVRVGLNREIQPRVQQDSTINFWSQFGVTNVFGSTIPNNLGIPRTTITGYSIFGGATNLPQNRWDTTYTYHDSMTYQFHAHSLKFGGEFRSFDGNQALTSTGRGSLTFTGATTAPTSGYALADALLGYPTSTANSPLAPIFYGREKSFNAFLQDDWTVSKTLTLNLGVRWEYNEPFYVQNNNLGSFNLQTGQIVYAGQNGASSYLYNPNHHNFAPRLGIAWQPFGSAKTVLRIGSGYFYDQSASYNGLSSLGSVPPYRISSTYNSSLATPILLTNPFPASLAGGTVTAAGIQPNYTTPVFYEWSFGIQRQLATDTLLDLTYFATKGTYLPVTINANQPAPGAGTTAQVNARRPFPNYGTISYYESVGNSSYQSLQMKLEKRYSHGLTVIASDTYGKSIDNSPGAGATSDASKITPQNSSCLACERGLSDFNVKNRFVVSAVWELPFGKGQKWVNTGGVAGALVGGWQINTIFTTQTGKPFTPYISANVSNTFGGADRPNVVAGCDPNNWNHTLQSWINAACFTTPAAGTFGNEGRNNLIGPGLVNLDFSIARTFAFRERFRIQFRAESFNILNHPNFYLPATTFDAPATFSSISTAFDPRQMQAGLKVVF